jgi:Anti-sigma-K factor rskA
MLRKAIGPRNTSFQTPPWWMVCIGLATLAAFIAAGWYAGHRSGTIQQGLWSTELARLTQELATTRLAYQREAMQLSAVVSELRSSGKGTALKREQNLQRQLLKAEADAEHCKEIVDRQQLSLASTLSLVSILSQPDVQVFPMKVLEPARSSIAYVVLIPSKKLILVASRLPALGPGRQWQAWILRRGDPRFVSAGLLTPAGGTAVVQFTNADLIAELGSVAVTDEPVGGSATPTGPKLLATESSDRTTDS